jgi:hypothetical protein
VAPWAPALPLSAAHYLVAKRAVFCLPTTLLTRDTQLSLIGPPETLPMMSLLSSVTESTPNTLTHSCRTASPQIPSSPFIRESLWGSEMYDTYKFSILWAAFLLACLLLLTDLQQYSYYHYVPVYITVACLQLLNYVNFTATAIYSLTSHGPAAGGSYSQYPCGLPS